MRVCQWQRRHLWESLRESTSVPSFTRAFLKSPSSRGLSAIAELLVSSLRSGIKFITADSIWFFVSYSFENARNWQREAFYDGEAILYPIDALRRLSLGASLRAPHTNSWRRHWAPFFQMELKIE